MKKEWDLGHVLGQNLDIDSVIEDIKLWQEWHLWECVVTQLLLLTHSINLCFDVYLVMDRRWDSFHHLAVFPTKKGMVTSTLISWDTFNKLRWFLIFLSHLCPTYVSRFLLHIGKHSLEGFIAVHGPIGILLCPSK